MKILENLWQSSESFGNLRKQLKNVRKFFGSVRKSSEFFGKLRKRFKSHFQMILCFFKIFGKSSEVFGNLRKFSENFGNGSKLIFRCFNDFLIFLKI